LILGARYKGIFYLLLAALGVSIMDGPVSAFYQNGKDDKVLRFCFSKKKETLEAAVENFSNV
jgi:aspartate/methionine/tyrosine aminotransferase